MRCLAAWPIAAAGLVAVGLLLLFDSDSASLGPVHAAQAGAALTPVEANGRATLKGKITVKGGVPAALLAGLSKKIQSQMKDHQDRKCCLSGKPEEISAQVYRIGDNKQVGNVFVWVQPPKGSYFPIDAAQVAAAKKTPVEIGQPHCAFLPHCAIHFPVYPDPAKPTKLLPTGQTFTAINDAPVSHSVLWSSKNNPGPNKTLPAGDKLAIELVPDRLPVLFKCTIHMWMDARVGVFNHPYATLSRSDTAPRELRVKKDDATFGTYEIANIPAGVKLRLFAWHEEPGFLSSDGFAGEEIEFKPGLNERDFALEVK
jgi:hypothetical protein